MIRPLLRLTVVAACFVSTAHAVSPKDLEWLSGLSGRVEGIHNPVVVAWAIGRLAAITCPLDQPTGSALFRKAISDLHNLPDDAFDDSQTVLPAATFTGLWKLTVPPAINCNPGVVAPDERINWKLTAERGRIDTWLSRSISSDDPDRAAELIDAALSVAEPGYVSNFLLEVLHRPPGDTRTFAANHEFPLMLGALLRALIHLRFNAPDLADDLFRKSLDFMMATPPVPVNRVAALGSYLFVAPKDVDLPEPNFARTIVGYPSDRVRSNDYLNLMAVRPTATSDAISDYIATAVRLLQDPGSTRFYAIEAYALAYSLQPKASVFAPQSQAELAVIAADLAARIGAKAAAVQTALGPAGPLNEPLDAQDRRRDFALVAKVRAESNAGRFDAAREAQKNIAEDRVRSQLEPLIAFSEASQALQSKQYDRALSVTDRMAPGVKRALLYAANMANPDRPAALGAMHIGLKEAGSLLPAQRACVLSALASSAISLDPEEALTILNQLVAAGNDLTGSSRTGFRPKADSANDLPYVLCGPGGVTEVVETSQGRQIFALDLAAMPAFTLETLLPRAASLDFSRVEASVLQLRDEFRLARAMVALARLRFGLP